MRFLGWLFAGCLGLLGLASCVDADSDGESATVTVDDNSATLDVDD